MTVMTFARRLLRLLLPLGLLLPLVLLAQCQPVPRPFAAAHKGDFSAIQVGPRAGMLVLPVNGAVASAAGGKLAMAMAKALRQREITAKTGQGHRRSHRLQGTAVFTGYGQLQLTWRLRTAGGEESMAAIQEEAVAPSEWRGADDGLFTRLAGNGAEAIDRQLRRRERGQGRRISLATVTLGPIAGAPGPGGGRLAAAMRAALIDAGVPLAEEPPDDGFILLGSIHAKPIDGNAQQVEITWQLIRPDGSEFGKVSQANRVPAAQLNGDWEALAQVIARAGAPGVLDLLQRDPGV
jgi:hypothetical protein